MEKLKEHFKNNGLIYLILVTCIIIFSIIYYVNRHPAVETEKINTSIFYVVDVDQALMLFNSPETKYLVIGSDTCSATHDYVEHLRYSVVDLGLKVYYLDLDSIDREGKDAETYNKFVEKLDLEYNLKDIDGVFGDFMGATPMTIIIKNKKQVHGHIGSMNTTAIEAMVKLYEL